MQLKDIYAARGRIRGRVVETALQHSRFLSELCGGEVWLKLENQQLTGSFKIRGALNKMLKLSDEEKRRGIVAASSGNHAQGVGYAARELGLKATFVVPRNTPDVKLDTIRGYGVELIVHGDEYMEAEGLAHRIERDEERTYVSSYNDLDIIAGQGTIGLEMVEEVPDLDTVLVPVGGGGLVSGVGSVYKAISGDVEVLGVQSVASPVMAESVKLGQIVEIALGDSIAEGLHGGIEEGSVTLELCREVVDDFILVKEELILKAIQLLLLYQHQVVEGSGAVGVSAIIENPDRFRDRRVGVVISGGNIGEELLGRAVSLK